jgi:hypothetical protein
MAGGPEDEPPETPEPKDKVEPIALNGPEDADLEWDASDWRRLEDGARRLQQRIFTAMSGE